MIPLVVKHAGTDILRLFGQTVRKRRMELDLSQEALAERAGLHRTYLADIERGVRNVSLKNVEKLADALELSISELFVVAVRGGRG
jgi:transcriptional regulator with XRE-family HTH domain